MEVMTSRVVVRDVLLLVCGFHGVGVSGTWRFVDCRSSAADRPSRVTRHGERLIGPEQAGILKLFEAHTVLAQLLVDRRTGNPPLTGSSLQPTTRAT